MLTPSRIWGFAPILLLTLPFCGCESRREVSAKLQDLRARYEQIQDEITEEDVIGIFDGYKSVPGELVRELNANSKPLKRPSKYARMFCEKNDAIEGDHFVQVYFDGAGYVVGKDSGAFCR